MTWNEFRKSYYDILQVLRGSSDDQIKRAYKKFALKYHPDKNQGNEEANKKFAEINNGTVCISVSWRMHFGIIHYCYFYYLNICWYFGGWPFKKQLIKYCEKCLKQHAASGARGPGMNIQDIFSQ